MINRPWSLLVLSLFSIASAIAITFSALRLPTTTGPSWTGRSLAQEIGDPVSSDQLYLPLAGPAVLVEDLPIPIPVTAARLGVRGGMSIRPVAQFAMRPFVTHHHG